MCVCAGECGAIDFRNQPAWCLAAMEPDFYAAFDDYEGEDNFADFLFAYGGAGDDASEDGDHSALHAAVEENDLASVAALVEAGADIEELQRDPSRPPFAKLRRTPLYHAAQKGFVAVAQYLVQRGANKETVMGNGGTALCVAAGEGHIAMAQKLIELGAIKNAASHGNWTPLIWASYSGRVAMGEYLLEQVCDIEQECSTDGRTALLFAASNGHLGFVELLLRNGARLDVRDRDGLTAADLAIEEGHFAIADAIRAEDVRRRRWAGRRMAMFVAFKAATPQGAKQPLLTRLRLEVPDIVRNVVSFL